MMETILSAAAAFCATNLDDLLLLTLLFSAADTAKRRRAICLGQLLGIGVLALGSMAAAAALRQFLLPYVPFLGIVPIFLGILALIRLKKQEENSPDAPANLPGLWGVALVTLANGGDNLSVYIPLFAGQTLPRQLVALLVFGGMTLLWCALAQLPQQSRRLATALRRVGRFAIPFVLIFLGCAILWGGI